MMGERRHYEWSRWFAWHPIVFDTVWGRRFRWLSFVYRRRRSEFLPWEYRVGRGS